MSKRNVQEERALAIAGVLFRACPGVRDDVSDEEVREDERV